MNFLRELAPQVTAALVRRYGDFDEAEDATQEALLAAATPWPQSGTPDHPRAWLIRVASRKLIDQWRSNDARARREEKAALLEPVDAETNAHDDTLAMLVLCCHESLTAPSQIALTLRAVGGLSTQEIAQAFFVPEKTMGQRISRAKQTIREAGARFTRDPISAAVLHVLYLIFNEGYTSTAGPDLHRVQLTHEAIRLTRQLHAQVPDDGEVAGLLALMLLHDARRPARTGPDGSLIPLHDQDRTRWDATLIGEGTALVTRTLKRARIGPYQVQAAIAAVHAEARKAGDTDWPQIVALYRLLEGLAPNPMTTLNRAVAVGMAHGPAAGLELLRTVETDPRLVKHHRLHAVKAHLLEMAGDPAARESYLLAARLTTSLPEQNYLLSRSSTLRNQTSRQ